MKLLIISLACAALLLACVLAAAIAWGGPQPIAAMDSINAPFAKLDYSALPAIKRYTARDGAALAYRHYASGPVATGPASAVLKQPMRPARRIVLVHGSSASSRSMHPLALALQAAGFTVDALDVRGHGDSGPRGHLAYIGQLEDDLADFMRAVPNTTAQAGPNGAQPGPSSLMGFSAGGGFALRFAASPQAALFDRYVLLAPFLLQAPTNKPSNGGWASVGVPRIVALMLLNKLGIRAWNDLPVTQFALNDEAKKFLTPSYSFALSGNFGTHLDYASDIQRAPAAIKLVAGNADELMFSERYAHIFAAAGKPIAVTLAPGAGHIGLTLNAPALAAIVAACQD